MLSLTVAAGIVLFGVASAAADELELAKDRFFRSSAQSEVALERALREAAPEARPALERALGEVRAARERTMRELAGAHASPEGRARALQAVDEAAQTHLRVLSDVHGKVPAEAQPSIERAMDVSRRGHESAVGAVGGAHPGRGPVVGVPSGAQPGPPAGVRGSQYGERPAGAPAGRPSGSPGGFGGVRGGAPAGRPGR